jgi:hypothetical protein
MKRVSKYRTAEVDLGRQSRQVAEEEPDLLRHTVSPEPITEFIEWRAFSYWLRLTVETQGFVSDPMVRILQKRCPGVLEYAAADAKEHPREPGFPWLRFLEWTDQELFQASMAEGWRHALGYYATRDPQMD